MVTVQDKGRSVTSAVSETNNQQSLLRSKAEVTQA